MRLPSMSVLVWAPPTSGDQLATRPPAPPPGPSRGGLPMVMSRMYYRARRQGIGVLSPWRPPRWGSGPRHPGPGGGRRAAHPAVTRAPPRGRVAKVSVVQEGSPAASLRPAHGHRTHRAGGVRRPPEGRLWRALRLIGLSTRSLEAPSISSGHRQVCSDAAARWWRRPDSPGRVHGIGW